MALHVRFTFFAFRLFPLVALLLALASRQSRAAPRRVVVAWIVLAAVLAGYVAVLGWGPSPGTPSGLTTQVIAQKIVALAAVLTIAYQSDEADRAPGIGRGAAG
jgi:CHASE2 domain-containing sensor protein